MQVELPTHAILSEALAFAASADDVTEASRENARSYEELTDDEWAIVEPFLWQASHSIVPARLSFDGFMEHLVDGTAWAYVGGGFASRQFLVRRVNNGSIHRMLKAAMPSLSVERQAEFELLRKYADAVLARRRLLMRRGGIIGQPVCTE